MTATSYENPLSSLSAIANTMRETSHTRKETVLFDFLCSNGEEWNRFAFINYNGTDFERSTFSIVSKCEIPPDLIEKQTHFFEVHPEYLRDSVLG